MTRAGTDLDIFYLGGARPGSKLKPSTEAVLSDDFWRSRRARSLRILCEMQETMERMEEEGVAGTFMFFGSARAKSAEDLEAALNACNLQLTSPNLDEASRVKFTTEAARLKTLQWLTPYFDITEQVAHDLSAWALGNVNADALTVLSGWRSRMAPAACPPTNSNERPHQCFFVSTGGGPGLMLAANKGAHRSGARSIGLGVVLPFEPGVNKYVSPSLAFTFQYFFTRKFWMLHQATALVAAPGGFGTLDELFEAMALRARGKVGALPVVLLGTKFWSDVLHLDALVEFGVVAQEERDAIASFDTADAATAHVIAHISTPVAEAAAVVPDAVTPEVAEAAVADASAAVAEAVAARDAKAENIMRGSMSGADGTARNEGTSFQQRHVLSGGSESGKGGSFLSKAAATKASLRMRVASPVSAEPPMAIPNPFNPLAPVVSAESPTKARATTAGDGGWEDHYATTEQPFGTPKANLSSFTPAWSPAAGGAAAGMESRGPGVLTADALSPVGRPTFTGQRGNAPRSDVSDAGNDSESECTHRDVAALAAASPLEVDAAAAAGGHVADVPSAAVDANCLPEFVPVQPAFQNSSFLGGPAALHVRILAEFEDAARRLELHKVYGTYNFFGLQLIPSEESWAETRAMVGSQAASGAGKNLHPLVRGPAALEAFDRREKLRGMYALVREISSRLTRFALDRNKEKDGGQRYFVCTNGGPGVDEAANRGADDAGGKSIGMGVLGRTGRHRVNGFVSDELAFVFRYPFARKFWSVYLSKAVVVAPGAWDTLDQLFEVMTLKQTGKLGDSRLPIVLLGKDFWNGFIQWEKLVEYGVVSGRDIQRENFLITDSADEAIESVMMCVDVCRSVVVCVGGEVGL